MYYMRVADHYNTRHELEEQNSELMESHNQKTIAKYYPLFFVNTYYT